MGQDRMERELAVERRRAGETVDAICESLKRSRSWFYKWFGRASSEEEEWAEERSRARLKAGLYNEDVRRAIIETRERLESEGCFVSAEMIAWELDAAHVKHPSVATIKRILKAAGLTGRKKRVPTGTRYPAPLAIEPGAVHQADFVGPRHVSRVRFYSLNAVDVCSARAAAEPVRSRATENVIPALWRIWSRMGIPSVLQLDNELVFFGNRRYPGALGQVMRLCLHYAIEMVFIPVREPWRNGLVEKFNDHWNRKFYNRISIDSFDRLQKELLAFESRHNSTWRYSKLGGRTPNRALAASSVELRFPDRPTPPPMPLSLPTEGRITFIRFIRTDRTLEIFGQRRTLPPEATHEYVRATIDIAARALTVRLHDEIIDVFPYPFREPRTRGPVKAR